MNKQSTAIVPGSLSALAHQHNTSIAETFIGADVVVFVDTSGSMSSTDSKGDQSRYKVACDELARLQNTLPGKIAVISFSNEPMFCPNGVPYYFGGGTKMDKALHFGKMADVPGMRFILISDGEPNNEGAALRVAKTYTNRIDTIYVGPEDYPEGREFLERLAKIGQGMSITMDRAKELAAGVQYLLRG